MIAQKGHKAADKDITNAKTRILPAYLHCDGRQSTRIHPTTAQTPQPPSTYLAQCSDRYIGGAEKYYGILRTTRKSGRLSGENE